MPEPIADVLARLLAADDVIGVLTRETDVRLVNISVAGCLLESSVRLEPGTTGLLSVVVDGRACEDTVRVTRVVPVYSGGSRWRVGVEFLWTSRPGRGSLRRMVSRLRVELARHAVAVAFAAGRVM
jgi:hypothetical protein